ncbi:Nonribosomal peptide synthetase 12 [Cytospora mali]|uniref:Nonribosomal peptide synthetase 12 n=1 Tax=Cytospora mali TaxID=578113 RepID=A0A194UP20_CYTMA|nr:Nonribosomal peptide synthetase 12 [Valsa mali var. pyri (nom. inval.)]
MEEDRTRAKRSSLPRIDTSSTSDWQKEQLDIDGDDNSQQQQPRPRTLEDRILSSVASSLSLSPDRLRESLASGQHGTRGSAGTSSGTPLVKAFMEEDITIKTKVISGSRTLADVETKVAPYSAHSMSGSLVEPEGDEEADSEEDSEEEEEVDVRSASVMIAPEKIHRASRMDSHRLRPPREDFNLSSFRNTTALSAVPPNPLDTPNEVELFLGSEKAVSKVVILKPRAGLFDEKLVACLTLSSIPSKEPESPKIELISPSHMFFAGTQIATIKHNLKSVPTVDVRAIPEVWIPLDDLPSVPETGEIDRRKLRTWVQNANQDVYESVMSLGTDQPLQQPSAEMEKEVQRLVARVLQIPPEQVGMNFTFAQLGGDEVTAMALVTNARVESIFLESHEIMQSNNTLARLAVLATQRGGLAHKWAAEEEEKIAVESEFSLPFHYFDLSPMQKLYFNTRMGGDSTTRAANDGSYRFNQSLLLRVARRFSVQDISAATDAVVGHHSMLRARFANVEGVWMQRILPDVEGSYVFMHYAISTDVQLELAVHHAQVSINVQDGPVFAVAHFTTTDGHQMIYLAAHHLVVDVASWRLIIQDLDELLQSGSLLSQRSMPFQRWTELQKLDAQIPSGGLPFDIYPGDLEYWGLVESNNTYGDANEASFSLSSELTSILETTCNQVLQTDAVDIYVAALLLSFAQTFPDRRVPDVWNQEYGRDLWSNDIDITETVGWFTTLCPLTQQINAASDFIDVLRRLKDTRRAIPHRGAHYFASKFFTPDNKPADAETNRPRSPNFLQIATRDWPIELLFSYAGSLQDLGKDPLNGNGVLEQMALPGRTLDSSTSDIGPAVGRIALFEVNTTIDQGAAKIKFLYNRHSLHADKITTWIHKYEHLLYEAIGRLRFHEPELTLADIPQLWATGATYEGLSRLNGDVIADLGLNSIKDIEAVYPVTPLQQSILVSQAAQMQLPPGAHGSDSSHNFVPSPNSVGNANACHIHTMYEFASLNGAPVDLERICVAWGQVVTRHQALRTVFIDSVAEEGLYNAVVLRRSSPNMLFLDATSSEDPVDTLNNLPPLTACPALKSIPRHRLTVCHSPMKTVIKLDVSAALCDMMSVNALIADLRRGYATGRALPITSGDAAVFSYSGYLDILRGLDRERSIGWWRDTLAHVTQPCLFPRLDFYYGGENKTSKSSRRYDNVHVELSDVLFHKVVEFGRTYKTTTGAILRLAWGLVLRAVTGTNAVCFGYRAPGRSATLEGMRSAVGCFANTIAVTFDLAAFMPLGIVLRQVEDGYNAALPHQHITMAEVRHALTSGKRGAGVDVQLFNTVLTFTEEPADLNSGLATRTNFELRNVLNHETSDYDLTINTRFSNSTGRLVVDLGHSILSERQAHNIANTFGRAVSAVLKCASASSHIGSLDLFSDRDYAQIINWTNPGDKEAQHQQRTLLHDLVFAQSIARPDSKAVYAHDGDLTYAQLEILSHRLAHVLLEAGVAPRGNNKCAVPVILDKSKWAPIALLAILKVGAAFVPIDADEMAFVAKVTEQLGPICRVAVACKSAAEALSNCTDPAPLFDHVVCLDDVLMKRLERETPIPGQLLPPSNPEDVACVFFTPAVSRATRGISFTHASLSTAFVAQGPAAYINTTTRVLQLSSFTVDVALTEIFTTLVNGGAICIPTSRDRYNDYTGCVTRFSANWSYMTPLLARKLNVDLLPTLKTVCFRTRGLDEDTYAPWRGRKRVVMAYGAPDVCPLGISFLEIHGPHHLRAIGRPIAGSAWIVSVEDHRNLMPVGAVGEMVIEGPTLGRTFRRSCLSTDADESRDVAETPVSPESRSPFTASNANGHSRQRSVDDCATGDDQGQNKKRYYKTGHNVRYIEGGLMELVSSKREDLEINGRVVNLADLEQQIRRALGQGVDVMVEALAFKGERGRPPTLAAFLELGSDANTLFDQHGLDLSNLGDEVKQRVFIAKQLVEKALSGTVPDFMVPKIFVPVKHLPTTYSLKVNRRKLQKIIKGMSREQLLGLATMENAQQVQSMDASVSPPMCSLAAKVRATWARVLGIDEGAVGVADGFIKLGGDEISATEVVVQCRKEKLAISIAHLMQDVSLAEVCRAGHYYGAAPGQALTTADDNSTTEKTLAVSLQFPDEQPPSSPTAATAPAPQDIDKTFVENTLAPKLAIDPSLIRDVAEATATQIRHIETAMMTQGPQRSSHHPHGQGLANVSYLVFQFTAASSTTSVSARRIEEVCQILASVHPILRTAFIPHVEGQTRKMYQVVLKNHVIDFKHIPRVQGWRLSAAVDKEIKRDREKLQSRYQLDLFTRPITKFTFLDAGKTSTLMLRLSRAQYDDLSIALLLKDLRKLYDGGQNPPRRPGFADFVREAALANVGGEAEKYWRGLLEGAQPTQVVRHSKPPKLSSAVRTLHETVPVSLTSMAGLGIGFDTVLKAAWGMVLASISGTPDVVFGEVIEGCHSRLQYHLGPSSVNRGGVLGPTSTVLPVRIRFADDPTSPLNLLKSVAEQRSAGVPYENFGMLDVIERCTPWPYWTRLSTVVQHRTDAETLLVDGRSRNFRLGAALCKVNVVESEVVDVADFVVKSVVKNKPGVSLAAGANTERHMQDDRGESWREGDELLEVSVSFCEQRVPATLAQEVITKVCGYVAMLTGVSILQTVVPTAAQYSALTKQIPLSPPVFPNSPISAMSAASSVNFANPFGSVTSTGVNFAQLEAMMTPDQTTTIQTTIEEAWRNILDPRVLGVPEEHVTSAAFYDLWGSLIPAAELADFLTETIPTRLVGDLAANVFGGNFDGFRITMEEIVDHPTMLGQFELLVRKIFGGEARDRLGSFRSTSRSSLPHSVRKSSSLTNMSGNNSTVRKSNSNSNLTNSKLNRAGTIGTYEPSKLGHSRTRSDSTTNTAGTGSANESPATGSTAVFPSHPAVHPPTTPRNAHHAKRHHTRSNSNASNTTRNTGGGSVITVPTSITNTPPTSIDSPVSSVPSELPGSGILRTRKSNKSPLSIQPESPVLGVVNLAASPPVVQTGFTATRKKSNLGLSASLRRVASTLRPGATSGPGRENSRESILSRTSTNLRSPPPSRLGLKSSDRPSTSESNKSKETDLPPPPVSPWLRVQSMAPQLPPFPPFTPVTEDAFSMNSSGYTSSEGRRTGPSPDLSLGDTSGGSATTSPDLCVQHDGHGAKEIMMKQSVENDPDGQLSRAGSCESMTEGESAQDVDENIEEEDEEDTLRPHQVQNMKYLFGGGLQPPAQFQPSQSQQRQSEPLEPSPVSETFYKESDDEEDEDGAQYDSYEEFEDGPETPRQPTSRPVTMIHSPQKTKSSERSEPDDTDVPNEYGGHGQTPTTTRFSNVESILQQPQPLSPQSAQQLVSTTQADDAATAGSSTSGGTHVMDFAAIEAAEMDDLVSPLTPVERAMLYKQQGLGRNGSNRVANHVSPLTPSGYFTQTGQSTGGFHAI